MRTTSFSKLSAAAGLAFGGALAALALGALAQTTTWTAPSATPPGNNVAAPLNVGTSNQTKTGGSIQINGGFGIAGGPFIYIPSGVTPAAGQVLTADATTPGKVVWATAPGGGATFLGVAVSAPWAGYQYDTPFNFNATVPSGATYAIVSIDGTDHAASDGDQSVGSGKIYIDFVNLKTTGDFVNNIDSNVNSWTNVALGANIALSTASNGASNPYNFAVTYTASTSKVAFTLPTHGAAFFQFYK